MIILACLCYQWGQIIIIWVNSFPTPYLHSHNKHKRLQDWKKGGVFLVQETVLNKKEGGE